MRADHLVIIPATDSIIEDVTEELGENSASSALLQQAREHMATAAKIIEVTGTYGENAVISNIAALLHEQRAANLLALITLNGNAARFS